MLITSYTYYVTLCFYGYCLKNAYAFTYLKKKKNMNSKENLKYLFKNDFLTFI